MSGMKLVYKYFSDMRKSTIATVVIFAIAEIVCIYNDVTYGKYTIVPICCFIILMLSIRYYQLWFKAKADIRKGEITEENVTINTIYPDKKFNFVSKGTQVGDTHFIIEDTKGDRYRLFTKDWSPSLLSENYYTGVPVKVQYLNNSRIVSSLSEIAVSTKEQRTQYHAKEFCRELKDYFGADENITKG